MHAEDHHAQADADLRRGEPGAVEVRHGVAHVGQQGLELRRAEGPHFLRALEKPWIAHAQNFPDHLQSCSMMRRTRPIASSSTAPILSSGTARWLSPRPAA